MRIEFNINSYNISLFTHHNVSKVLLFLFGSFGTMAYAQENDTIKINANTSSAQDLERLNTLPISYSNQVIKDFTQTEVYFNHTKNKFARKQTAKETNRFGFRSQGLFNLKNDFKVFGTIKLEKFLEKSLAYNLDNTRTDDLEVLNPTYFFVPRAADWDNQQYDISAGIIKNFGNFNIAAKADLNAEKFARKADPRPEISTQKLNGELQAGYTYNQHQIFVFSAYGKKDKDYKYNYTNSQLNSIAYPETYIRFNSGYGRVINQPYTKNRYFSRTSFNKFGGGYQFKSDKTQILGYYNYQKSLEDFYNEYFKDSKYLRFKYQTISHLGQIQLRQKIDNKLLRASIKGSQSTSKNFDVVALGTNYINRLRNVTFDVNLLNQQKEIVHYYLGAYASYNQNRYLDQLGYTDYQINSLNIGVYGNHDFVFANQSKINLGLAVNYYTALKNNLNYVNILGDTENMFYDNVILHDNIYNSTDRLDTKADLRYMLPVKNNKNVVIYSQFRSIFALNNQVNTEINFDKNTSYQINFGIQLNY